MKAVTGEKWAGNESLAMPFLTAERVKDEHICGVCKSASLGERKVHKASALFAALAMSAIMALALSGCGAGADQNANNNAGTTNSNENQAVNTQTLNVNDHAVNEAAANTAAATTTPAAEAVVTPDPTPTPAPTTSADAATLRAQLDITEDYRASFVHGAKPAAYQKYIVLHDTEGDADGESVVNYWDGNGRCVAAQFVINKDGSIVQCVGLDEIAHHAGYGDTGHNDAYGIVEDGRDDMVGTTSIGSWASDYGMNAWSVGIELVHVGGSGDYPEAQLAALDTLIAYIDAYYGFESTIIDHKAWRTGNSDTSAEFAGYFANYQDHRTHI